MRDINQVLLNPVRSRIIQYVARHQTVTAGDLAAWITDVPRTTLYRHLKILTENNVLTVVAENRVRGSVERTYALNITSLSEQNSVENATRNAFGFLMKLYSDFERYFSRGEVDQAADKFFLSNISLLLSETEFNELLGQLNELLKRYIDNPPNESRRARSISFISSPCDNTEGGRGDEAKE